MTDVAHTETPARSARRITGLPFTAEEITTDRLRIRPLCEADLDRMRSYQGKDDLTRYLLWEVRDHDQVTIEHEHRRALSELTEDCDGLIYAVELPEPDGGHGRVIGDLSVRLTSIENAQMEIGWVFHPAVHQQGYTVEAARAVLKLCFETLGARRVSAELDPDNDSSARLCEELGMRREAHLRENVVVEGEWRDTLVFGMLEREWQSR